MAARDELTRRAQAHGVAVSYRDWRGRAADVPDETLAAVLDVLGDYAPPAEDSDPRVRAASSAVAPFPARRSWGFAIQLYSVRSRASWGHGDLHDLADLASWSARELGAGFVLVNPLHAAEPVPPVSPSPYLPMSRRQISPLYLRIEDIGEYQDLDAAARAQVEALATPLRAASTSADLIDRDAVWAAKRAALELIHAVPLSPARRAELDAFLERDRQAYQDWATWCAITEVHGPDWRSWPQPLTDPRSAAVAELRRSLADRVGFHAWVQWLTAGQLAAAQRTARQAGMGIGIIADLAVGAHPGGADAWARQDVIVPGMSVGAPPDEFNQRGQNWTLPPWNPGQLAAQAGRPLAELTAATVRSVGGLRVDHVMGLARLWWIPEGMSPGQGTYVRYDHELTAGAVAAEVARSGALAIGEDLGTVEPWLRAFLASRQILGTSMLWFERRADGKPRSPRSWRRGCLAQVGTHDMPPAATFLTGEQVTIRSGLGLLTQPEADERAAAAAELELWLSALTREGLLSDGLHDDSLRSGGRRGDGRRGDGLRSGGRRSGGRRGGGGKPSPEEFTTALYAFLTRTPAILIGVSLADAAGERRPQNMPGTVDEYPNWRVPLADASQQPVLLEDLPGHAGIQAVARAVSGGLRR